MDDEYKLRLIEEVKKRPLLWDNRLTKKNRLDVYCQQWNDVGNALGRNVHECKVTWKKLRSIFRQELRRTEERISKAKNEGTYNPNVSYYVWSYYTALSFLADSFTQETQLDTNFDDHSKTEIGQQGTTFKSYKIALYKCPTLSNNSNDPENDNTYQDETQIQLESDSSSTEEEELPQTMPTPSEVNPYIQTCIIANDPAENEQIQSTEQNGSTPPSTYDPDCSFLYSFLSQVKLMSQCQNMEFRANMKQLLLQIFPASTSVDVLDKQLQLEKDSDTDKNFLISFWPLLKSMPLLQNLQFRANMTDIILNILSTDEDSSLHCVIAKPAMDEDKHRILKDKFRLIEEVKKRPVLWDNRIKRNERLKVTSKLWEDVGNALGRNAYDCQVSWHRLRRTFCDEEKKIAERIKRAKQIGLYIPNRDYSIWSYYTALLFIADGRVQNAQPDLNIYNRSEAETTENSKTNIFPKQSDNNQLAGTHDSEQPTTTFKSYKIALYQCPTLSNNSNDPENDNTYQDETKIQLESDSSSTEEGELQETIPTSSEVNPCIQTSTVKIAVSVDNELHIPSTEQNNSSPPNTSDPDYSFLYSFLSQVKLMSQCQQMEFRANMKKLLLQIFPASTSVDVLDKQLQLEKDSDLDKNFLISFWPFLKSMSFLQNVQFRANMTDIVLNVFSTDANSSLHCVD